MTPRITLAASCLAIAAASPAPAQDRVAQFRQWSEFCFATGRPKTDAQHMFCRGFRYAVSFSATPSGANTVRYVVPRDGSALAGVMGAVVGIGSLGQDLGAPFSPFDPVLIPADPYAGVLDPDAPGPFDPGALDDFMAPTFDTVPGDMAADPGGLVADPGLPADAGAMLGGGNGGTIGGDFGTAVGGDF